MTSKTTIGYREKDIKCVNQLDNHMAIIRPQTAFQNLGILRIRGAPKAISGG